MTALSEYKSIALSHALRGSQLFSGLAAADLEKIVPITILKTLEKNGVKKFSPQGEKFDPNVHQAMYEIPTSDLPPGQVAEVIQAGYMIGERVLRPAMVAVSKAVQKTPASANDNS